MRYNEMLEKLDNVVNEFVEKFDCTAQVGPDFFYLPFFDMIFYELAFSKRQPYTRDFLASIKRQKPQIKLNPFVWSILHEVGHHETYYDLTPEQNAWCDKKKARIQRTKATNPYYNVLDEVLATKWAVNYANTHRNEVKEFEKKLLDIVKEIFETL